MNKSKILFSAPNIDFEDEFNARGISKLFDIDFYEVWSKEDLDKLDCSNYDFWIPNPGQNFVINSEILKNFSNLKIISTPSTGTNHINVEESESRNIKVYGLLCQPKGLDTISASAEFTFLKILASIRNLRFAWEEVREGRWRENEDLLRGREVSELIFGFIGMGRIGNKLLGYLENFSPKAAYFFDPYKNHSNHKYAIKIDDIETIFKKCDVITLCLSLTTETMGMINLDQLNQLKYGAHLINTSRGEIFDERALVSFLNERDDIHFSTDVIVGEVNDNHHNNPIRSLHNIKKASITPHIAGATIGSQTKAAILAVEILRNDKS